MTVTFIVAGTPQGKGRPRLRLHGGAYTPKKTRDYEKSVSRAYMAENGACAFTGPIKVVIKAYFPIPKSARKSLRERIISGEMVPYPHRPDADNIAKAILDGLNGVAWHDDASITDLEIHKYYGVLTGVIVTIKGEKNDTV